MKYALSIISTFLFTAAFAQSFKYLPASIHLSNGDIIEASVLDDNLNGFSKGIQIKNEEQEEIIPLSEIDSLVFENGFYLVNPDLADYDLAIPYIEGEMSLYLTKRNYEREYIVKKNSTVFPLVEKDISSDAISYKSQLKELINEDIELFNELKKLRFNQRKIADFVEDYNTKNGSESVKVKRPKPKYLSIKFGQTYNQNTYFNLIRYYGLSNKYQFGNFLALNYEVLFSKKYAFFTGLNYLNINGDLSRNTVNELITAYYLKNSRLDYVGIPLGFSFYPLNKKVKISIDALVNTQFIVLQEMIEENTFTNQEREIQLINDRFNFNFQFGTTVYYKNFGLSLRRYFGYGSIGVSHAIGIDGYIASLNYRINLNSNK